jgi:hypothetical protein
MFARRLIGTAGGGSVIVPPPELPDLITLTTAPDGGWTQVTEPKAVYYDGVTYFGYVAGDTGNAEIRTYDHGTETISAPTVLHGALTSPADTHDAPSIIIRPDGHIVAAYCAHVGGTMWVSISDSPEDISAFTEFTAHSGGTHTYPTILQRLSETNDPIYVFYRSGSGTGAAMVYVKSSDGGETWSGPTTVWDNNSSSYWKITTDSAWRIDFAVSTADPADPSSHIYHFYADDEDYKTSDGTPMTGQPFNQNDATLVYDGTSEPAWPHDLMFDGSGNPLILYGIELGGDSEYRYARWNGSSWVTSTVLVSAGAGQDVPTYGCHSSETSVHLVRFTDGQFEIWKYNRTGDTWDGGEAVTSGSSESQIYPARVHDADPTLGVLWLYGEFVDPLDFTLGIKGVPA